MKLMGHSQAVQRKIVSSLVGSLGLLRLQRRYLQVSLQE